MLAPFAGRLTIDLGTGDGRFVYESARRCPGRFFSGLDSNAAAMGEYSWKAARRPAKGGVGNALFGVASAEKPPPELSGTASRLTVILPWGSLLRTVALPDSAELIKARGMCTDGAELEVVLSYDATRDPVTAGRLALPPLSDERIRGEIACGYREAGFSLTSVRQMSRDELRGLPSTWAKRLAFGRPRPIWQISAKAV